MDFSCEARPTYRANYVLDKVLDRIEMEEPSDTPCKAYGGIARCTEL